VNVTRLARFDDAITEALGQADRIEGFRDIVGHYVEHHDVPEVDVAAALAVVAQGDTPLLLSADQARSFRSERDDAGDRGDRAARGDRQGRSDRGDRGDRGVGNRDERGNRSERPGRTERPERRARPSTSPMAPYRIEVGKRQKVEPRQIVGALANEGGLSREDFGAIRILPDHSVVELPADLSDDVLAQLASTRISGKLIEIRPDRGSSAQRDDRPPRKPRHR
jgi:ATP-dependent RNA helicase DeaD